MRFPSSRIPRSNDGLGAGPLLALVLIGLLADVARPEEAYAGIGYGLSLLAFLGAAGGAVCLTSRLAARLDPLPWAGPAAPAARLTARLATRLDPLPWASPAAPAARAEVPARLLSVRGEGWPLLVALLFGPLAALISGLGGWV